MKTYMLLPFDMSYYLYGLALGIVLFVSMSFVIPDCHLRRDIQELCFYDILAQCYVIYLFSLHGTKADKTWYYAIIMGIALLKFVRLFWLGRSPDSGAYTSWPVFGVVGCFYALLNKRIENEITRASLSKWHDGIIVLFLILSVPAGYLIRLMEHDLVESLFVLTFLFFLSIHIKSLILLLAKWLSKTPSDIEFATLVAIRSLSLEDQRSALSMFENFARNLKEKRDMGN